MTNRNRSWRLVAVGIYLVIMGCVQPAMLITPATVPLASEQADKEAKRFKKPPVGAASIFVMREDIFAEQGILFRVNLDGKDQGNLSRGTYFLFTVPSGKHIVDFTQVGGADSVSGAETIYAVEGGIYYLEIRPRSGFLEPSANILRIDLNRGRQLILGGRRAEMKPVQ